MTWRRLLEECSSKRSGRKRNLIMIIKHEVKPNNQMKWMMIIIVLQIYYDTRHNFIQYGDSCILLMPGKWKAILLHRPVSSRTVPESYMR